MTNDLTIQIDDIIARRSLLKHPFYQAWNNGDLPIESLKGYASQYYHFERSYPTFLSGLHHRCEDPSVRQLLLDNLWDEEHGENNHRAMWLDFCSHLGIGLDQVEVTEVHPKTQELLNTYAEVCNEGSFQEGLAVTYAYEAQVPKVVLEKIRGLKDLYGFDHPDALKFFEVHSTLDEEHSAKEAQALATQTALDDESAVETAVQRGLEAWWGFLDGVEERRRELKLVGDPSRA